MKRNVYLENEDLCCLAYQLGNWQSTICMPHNHDAVRTLRTLLAAPPGPGLLTQFVRHCNAIALAFIQHKVGAGSIMPAKFGLSPSDIAFDAISDLFGQTPDGKLAQVSAYFESLPWQTMEDAELLIHLRRLVVARTNRGLYRMFQEVDPALGKILRNTKLAIAELGNFQELDFFGEPCIAPALCDHRPRMPMIDRDCLERTISELVGPQERIPDILAKLGRYLREQDRHCRMVPVLWVAYAIRAVYMRTDIPQSVQPEVETTLSDEEVRLTLERACGQTKARYAEQYLHKGTLTHVMYDKYFEVIGQILTKRLISHDGHDVSLFKQLNLLVPGLTRSEYESTHKARIEYLARVAEHKALEMLKKDLSL